MMHENSLGRPSKPLGHQWRVAVILLAIAISGGSLGFSVFDLTRHPFAAINLGGAYFALRVIVEFGPRRVSTMRKVLMTCIVLAMVIGDPLMAAVLAPRPTTSMELARLCVYALGFLGPEVIIWALASAPLLHGTYRIAPRKRFSIPLPELHKGAIYDIHLTGAFAQRITPSEYTHVTIERQDQRVVQDLGIVRHKTAVMTLPLDGGAYLLALENHSPASFDITIDVYIHSFHLN